jgi:amino acid adenylation domain-containing protein
VTTAGDQMIGEFPALGRGEPLPLHCLTPVHTAVARFARATPSAIAVSSGGVDVNYFELDAWARTISLHLSTAGIRRGDRVAVLMEPCAEMIAVVVGILRLGAAYVPVDLAQSDRRIATILTDAAAATIVVSGGVFARAKTLEVPVISAETMAVSATTMAVSATDAASSPRDVAELGDVAYVIYTSGSTGEPKGVVVEHRQLAASTLARQRVYAGAPAFLLVSPLAFDSSVAGLWGTLAAGGRLVVAATTEQRDPERLLDLVEQQRVTRMLCVPSLYSVILDVAERCGVGALQSLDTVIVAGEALSEPLVRRHFATHTAPVVLVNEYGPTEATVWASYHRFDAAGPVSIGRPIPGASIYLLGADLRPVPWGVEAELFIGGAGVARGYLGRPEATDRAFLPDPFAGVDGARMYRTGDRARWNAAGTLDFCGRLDHQIKIRGHRVELVAIEAVLRAVPGVRDAIVVPSADGQNLIGFVLGPHDADVAAMRTQVAATLSAVMVPASIHVLDAFPLTVNGKVDRALLASLARSERYSADAPHGIVTTQAEPVGVQASREAGIVPAVAAAWAEVLDMPHVPDDENFFDLGGHSLAMFQLQEALERHTGHRLTIVDLFRHTTVAAQATLIRDGGTRRERPRLSPGRDRPEAGARRRQARTDIPA